MPSEAIRFLTTDEVVAIHERSLERFGGKPGLRDGGLLESALHRPGTGYYDDLSEMACALFESLLMNHPFVDGNKRVAFFATDVFLRLNGWQLVVEAEAAFEFHIVHLERGEADFEHLLPWIRDAIERLPGPDGGR